MKRFLLALALCCLCGQADAKVRFDTFDLEGHRGARDARPENTLAAFAYALEVGVSTLELDLQVSKDGHLVVCHDAFLAPFMARDAAGHWVDEKARPLIRDLTLGELRQYDVGAVKPLTSYWLLHGKTQVAVPGQRVPTLDEVFRLVEEAGASKVRFNIETKIDPRYPDRTPPPAEFVRKILEVVARHGMRDRVLIQSFDWRTLVEARRQDPDITTVALTSEQPTWGADGMFRQVGKPGPSPWMAGLDVDDFGGDYVKAAAAIQVDVVSPFYAEVTKDQVAAAHALGLKVVPWTVNAERDMAALIDLGVDGLITDRPADLRQVMKDRGMPLPPAMNTGRRLDGR